MKKLKGMSLPSMIVAGVLGAILAAVAISMMWQASEKQKVTGVASSIVSQMELMDVMRINNYADMEKYNSTAGGGDNDTDYLDDLVRVGLTKKPSGFFHSDNYTWEIRKVDDDNVSFYYIYIDSDDEADKKIIQKAIVASGLKPENVVFE